MTVNDDLDVGSFDYSAPAEVFGQRMRGRSASSYRRFETAAAAIGYVVEEMEASESFFTVLEVDEIRLARKEIRDLYDAREYPLKRKNALTRGQTGPA